MEGMLIETINKYNEYGLIGLFRKKDKNKKLGKYSFVNILNGTISPCEFDTKVEGMTDFICNYVNMGVYKRYRILDDISEYRGLP